MLLLTFVDENPAQTAGKKPAYKKIENTFSCFPVECLWQAVGFWRSALFFSQLKKC